MRSPLLALSFAALLSLSGCSKSRAPAGSACASGAAYCFTPSSSESDISAAFASAKDGDLITFAAGTYSFDNQLALGSASGVTIEGAGAATVFDFSGQQAAEDAIFAQTPSANLTFKNFTVKDSPGNAIKVLGVNGLTFDSLTVTWTDPDVSKHGAYGLYPVQASSVLIQNSTVSGANDSGIYVGQSQNVIVQNNECFQNVAGIEIENTYVADVHGNDVHDNTAGILVFGLPGLEQEGGHGIAVHANTIKDNNTANFGQPGDIVSILPAGTGFFVMACSNVEVYGNTFEGNETVAAAVISYFTSLLPVNDPQYDPYSSDVYLHGNTFTSNGTAPDKSNQLGLLISTGLSVFPGGHAPDVIFDGIVDCPYANPTDGGVLSEEAGTDAGGCGLPQAAVGPPANPLEICVSEPGASGICNVHLDELNELGTNLAQILDCDAGYLNCTLPAVAGLADAGAN